MTDDDDEMFAGMIAEALAPNARGIKAGEMELFAAGSGGRSIAREVTPPPNEGRHFAPVTPLNPKHVARLHELRALCPCGSGQFGYNLRSHTGELLMYCCFSCEQPRRATTDKGGGILTEDG